MQLGLYSSNWGLKQETINMVETEINNPINQYAFPDGRLKITLQDPKKKELSCTLYSLHKLYLQAIDAAAIKDLNQVNDEKQEVSTIFSILFANIFKLETPKTTIFDCAMTMNDSVHQNSAEFNCILDNFNSQPILNNIEMRKSLQKDQAYDAFTFKARLVCIFILIIFIKPIWQISMTEEPIDKWYSFFTKMLMIILMTSPVIISSIAQRLYPEWDSIIDYSICLEGAFCRYMTDGESRYSCRLANYKEYIDFFQSHPDAQPKTLYDLVLKIMSKSDFFSEMPFQDFEKEFTHFLNKNAEYIQQDPTLQFPQEEFSTILIDGKIPWVNYVAWPSENSTRDESKKILAIKNLQFMLRQHNFFLPSKDSAIQQCDINSRFT